jgi:hypothetical protein
MAQTMCLASFGPAGMAMASLRGLPIVVVGVAQGWDGDGKLTWLAHFVTLCVSTKAGAAATSLCSLLSAPQS